MSRLIVVLITSIIFGCSTPKKSSNDDFYDSFQDDFFEGVSSKDDTRSNVKEIDERELAEATVNKKNNSSIGYSVSDVQTEDRRKRKTKETPQIQEDLISDDVVNQDYLFSFEISSNDSLKSRLEDLLEPYGYKLIWKTDYDVFYENNVLYEDTLLVNILKKISADLLNMGIDIHMNVYLKNKVVLIYSVRS